MPDTEVQPGPETGAGNDDVRADVLAAIQQLKSGPDIEPKPAPETAAAGDADAQPSGQNRNERGQFTKTDGEAESVKTVPDADPAKDKPERPSTAAEPPTSWSADAKAEWSKLSPALQQAVLKRETEINDGGRRWSDEKRAYDETLAPVRGLAQQHGVDERETIKRLLSANEWLERDPKAAITAFAQAYGIDLSKPLTSNALQPQADPVVATLRKEVSELRMSQQQRETAEAARDIQAFAAADGHEHFEAVKERMGQLLGSGQVKDLQEAYDTAVWSNPSLRSQLIAAQTAKSGAEQRAAEKAAADKARAGAISLNGSPVGGPAPQAPKEYETVRDAVVAAFRQHAS